MGIFDRLMKRFIDVIEWEDSSGNTVIWKFPGQGNEIKMGAKLTVREGQVAIFMDKGKIADVFEPGLYALNTQNMPVMTDLKSWKNGFNNPFKADVYFVSTRMFTNQQWETQNPVIIRDAEFGPVPLRAYGSFDFSVGDPKIFVTQLSATNPDFQTENVSGQVRNIVVSRGMESMVQSKVSLLDLSNNRDEISKVITDKIQPGFVDMGLNLSRFLIENVALPAEVEQALGKRSEVGIAGNPGATPTGQVDNILKNNHVAPVANTPPPVAPPQISDAPQYFVVLNGKSEGPYSMAQLAGMASGGSITLATLVWKKGMAGWEAASAVEEVAAIFNKVPPPVN